MQEQRKVDDEDDRFDKLTSKNNKALDDFDVVDPSRLVTSSGGGWEVQNKGRLKRKIGFEIKKQLQSDDVMTEAEARGFHDVWRLQIKDRWRLYRKWVRDISQQHQNTIASVQGEYDRGMKELQDLRNAESYELLKEAHVIGMTTTGNDMEKHVYKRNGCLKVIFKHVYKCNGCLMAASQACLNMFINVMVVSKRQ